MAKWLTISGLKEEARKISWPNGKTLIKDTNIVLIFVGFFIAYFFLTEIVMVWFMRLLGVGI